MDEPPARDPPEQEIDPRLTFANERTFLAWNRTALALVAAGAAGAAFLRHGLSGGRLVVALPLIVLGGAVGLLSFRAWEQNERAMRRGEPLPRTGLPRALAYVVAAVAILTAILVIVDLAVR